MQLERTTDSNVYKMNKLEEVTSHLVELAIHLCDKSEDYVFNISKQ